MSEHNNAAYNWGSVSGGCGERDSGCQNTTMQPQLGECVRWMWRETVGVRTQQCSLQLGECVRWMWRERQWVSDHNNAAYNWGCVRCMWRERQWVSEHNNAATTGGVCQVDVERETVGVRTQQCSLQLGECVRWMWRERQWVSEHNNAAYNWGSVSGGCGERDSGCQNTTMQPTTGGVCQVDVERETVGVRPQQCSLQLGVCQVYVERETVGIRTQQCSHNWGSVSGGCGKGDSGCQNTTMQPTTGGVCQVDVERETVGVRTQQCSLQLGECVRWMWRERQWVSDHNNAAYNWGCVRCMWRERQWVSEHNNAATTGGVCQVDVERETVGVRTQQCSLQLGECVRWMWREKDSRCQNTTMQPTTGGVCQVDVERDSGCQNTTMQPTTGGVCQVDVERETVGVRPQQCSLQLGVCQVYVERETVGVRTQQCSLQLGECVRWMWRERQWVSEHNNAAYNWGSVSGGCGERDSGCQNTTMQPTTGGVCQVDVERETVGVRTQQCSLQLGECVRWMWRERQ